MIKCIANGNIKLLNGIVRKCELEIHVDVRLNLHALNHTELIFIRPLNNLHHRNSDNFRFVLLRAINCKVGQSDILRKGISRTSLIPRSLSSNVIVDRCDLTRDNLDGFIFNIAQIFYEIADFKEMVNCSTILFKDCRDLKFQIELGLRFYHTSHR